MKLWRPRFSLRTLAIVVTLFCAYFAAWEATKRYGLTMMTKETLVITSKNTGRRTTVNVSITESSPMPFLVRRDVGNILYPEVNPRYYLSIFGHNFKLYGDSQWKELTESPNP